MQILILKVFGIGNVIQSTPLFQALRALYPQAEVDVLCDRAGVEVLEGWDLFREVRLFEDPRKVGEMPGYDLYVISRPANSWLKHVVPKGARMVGNWEDMACWTRHEVEWNMELAYELGYEGLVPDPYFHLTEHHELPPVDSPGYVGIHIGSLPSWKWKKWPPEHWATLVGELRA